MRNKALPNPCKNNFEGDGIKWLDDRHGLSPNLCETMEWRIQGEKFGAPTPQRSVAPDGWRPLDINALLFGAYRSRNSD